ncbi:MAG TPA: RNA methyltransferase [Bacteroidia bacterium]|jgi:tRNA G18 (ribose-2'-O)-methylase SpoU|nr:RNA methyltransferase [Bacteroidia bacterium]
MNTKLKNEELGRLSPQDFKNTEKTGLIVLLDNVRSLHNVGSVFRTCDAFLVETLYLCGYTGTPPNKEINKTALGATESIEWKHEKDIISLILTLKLRKMAVFAVEQAKNAVFMEDFEVLKNQKYALVFGNEVNGVAQEVVDVCDGCIEIRQGGTKHSLNIAVSAGVVLWEFYKKLKK